MLGSRLISVVPTADRLGSLKPHELVDTGRVALAHHFALHRLRRFDRHPPGVQGILSELQVDTIQHAHQLVRPGWL